MISSISNKLSQVRERILQLLVSALRGRIDDESPGGGGGPGGGSVGGSSSSSSGGVGAAGGGPSAPSTGTRVDVDGPDHLEAWWDYDWVTLLEHCASGGTRHSRPPPRVKSSQYSTDDSADSTTASSPVGSEGLHFSHVRGYDGSVDGTWMFSF